MIWGLGHSLTVVVVGAGITLFGLVIPPRLGLSFEFCVALMLILLGIWNLKSILRWAWGAVPVGAGHAQPSSAETSLQTWLNGRFGNLGPQQIVRPFIVGVVHGLAGSAALALLALPLIQRPAWAVAYLCVFGIGTIAGMMVITAAIAWPCASFASRSATLGRRLAAASGMLSLGFGLFLVYQIGFVDKLLLP
jgi:high-affinity nickel-transport protein